MIQVITPKIRVTGFPNVNATTLSVTAGSANSSLDLVAKTFAKYAKLYYDVNFAVKYKLDSSTKVVVTDVFAFLKELPFVLYQHKIVAWNDTALYWWKGTYNLQTKKNIVYVTTTPWIVELYKTRLGVDALLVPRSVDDEYAVRYFNDSNVRPIDVVIISTQYNKKFDRKRTTLLYKLVREVTDSVYAICNEPFCTQQFTLSQEEKYKLLSKAKVYVSITNAEGFGMPFAEALSVGTPVVYVDTPFTRYVPSGTYSYPVPAERHYIMKDPINPDVDIPWHDFDPEKFKSTLRQALSDTLSKDTRLEMHEYVMRNFSSAVVVKKILDLIGNIT